MSISWHQRKALLLIVLLIYSGVLAFAVYFQEIGRISNMWLSEVTELTASHDGNFVFVMTSGKNSSIQIYRLTEAERENPVLSGPSSFVTEGIAGRKLAGLGAILAQDNNRVYTVSEANLNQSSGCLLSSYDLDSKGSLIPLTELLINNTKLPPYHQNIAGSEEQLFISCESELATVNIHSEVTNLTLNNKLPLADTTGLYTSAIIYDNQLNKIYLTYSSSPVYRPKDTTMYQDYRIDPRGKPRLNHGVELPSSPDKGFYTEHALLPANLFLIFFSEDSSETSGMFWTIDTTNSGDPGTPRGSIQFTVTNLLLGQKGNRLFYLSPKNEYNQNYQMGALRVDEQGRIERMPESLLNVTENYQNLILLPSGCELLALEVGLNNSHNGSLILYRINDPEAGCARPLNQTLMIAVVSTTFGLLSIAVVTGLITTFLCRWLRVQGAKKGYMPIGNPDY